MILMAPSVNLWSGFGVRRFVELLQHGRPLGLFSEPFVARHVFRVDDEHRLARGAGLLSEQYGLVSITRGKRGSSGISLCLSGSI